MTAGDVPARAELVIPGYGQDVETDTSGGVRVDQWTWPHGAPPPPAAHPAVAYLYGLAPGSRRTMRTALATVVQIALGDVAPSNPAGHDPTLGPPVRLAGPGNQIVTMPAAVLAFPWPALRYAHTQALRAALAERYVTSTANRHLAALRGVLKECWRLSLMAAEDYHRAADLRHLREVRLPAGRHVSRGEVAALVAACRADPSPVSCARDGAVLAVAFAAGLRVGELVTLDIGDLDLDTGELRVRGKGAKERTAYVRHGALAAVREWLTHRGTAPGALFCPVRSGRPELRRLSTQALYGRVQLRAKQAGLTAAISTHDARRTWISDLLDAGADLVVVRDLAGHASVVTTSRYDRRGEGAKRAAADLLHFPWGEAR